MAASIDATVGGSSANSYVTVAEADTYFEERQPSTTWDNASADDKTRALITATRRIDQKDFKGVVADPLPGVRETGDSQALKWPRNAARDDEGWTYLDDVIPVPVKRATFELAYTLLGDDEFLGNTGLEGFDRVKVGPLDVEPRHTHKAGELPENVERYLRPLLVGGGVNVRLLRS